MAWDYLDANNYTADRLAQLVEHQTSMQKAVVSNPGWSNT